MNAKQRGVALLLVLFIMALMVIIAVRINEHWQQLLQRSQYQQNQIETRWALLGAEALARNRLAQALQQQKQVSLNQPWHNVTHNLQLEGIEAQGLIRDRDGCFNINAL
ncbi:MAG: general secretion pathway protein GspK, partial [Enterobacteriaceae bacterium]